MQALDLVMVSGREMESEGKQVHFIRSHNLSLSLAHFLSLVFSRSFSLARFLSLVFSR